jgi:hypothetical protein
MKHSFNLSVFINHFFRFLYTITYGEYLGSPTLSATDPHSRDQFI